MNLSLVISSDYATPLNFGIDQKFLCRLNTLVDSGIDYVLDFNGFVFY